MKNFNINSYVNIRLTDAGMKILKSKYEKLLESCANKPEALKRLGEFEAPKVDENGYTRMQLWEVMNIFGSYMCDGNSSLPFETTIGISEEYLEEHNKGKSR